MDNQKEETIRKQMHEVLDIVLDGNGFSDRKRESSGTLPTLFFRFFGHISRMSVDMHQDGWEVNSYPTRSFEFRTDAVNDPEQIERLRDAVEEALKDKTESSILKREIASVEERIRTKREALSRMKKRLAKLEKEGK